MTATLLLGMILLQCSVVGNPWVCTRGEMLHTSKKGFDNCIICPRGTFMSDESHTNRQCYNCTRIENSTLEVESTQCIGTHDAEIDCICGHYRYMPRTKDEKEECRKCPDCYVPVDTTSSWHSGGPESTTLIETPVGKDDDRRSAPYTLKMENSYLLAFLFLFHFSPGGAYNTYCSSGERLHTSRGGFNVCVLCRHGTFMDEENHSFRECKPCTGIENHDVEVLVSACNFTHDAVILCTSGFYRRRARNVRQKDMCEKCTECPFPVRPCEGYYNTVCCPPNHDAVMTPEGVFVYKERPIVCGAGQFFRTSSEECLPCPAGTFMSDHSHTYNDCLKCEELSEKDLTQAAITRPCSRTAPTLFGCKAGYFRDPTQESLQIKVPCTPCRICDRHLAYCGMFHDAVCDDVDRMVSNAPTNKAVSIGDERQHEKSPPEMSMTQTHKTMVAVENMSHSNKNDSELPSSTERLDISVDWILLLMCVTLLLLSTLLLILTIFLKKQSKLTADHKYDNTLHQCGYFKRFVHTIMLFALISPIVLLIFQIVVMFGAIKPTASALMAFKCCVTGLSILVLAANVIIYCTHVYITIKSRRRLRDVIARK